MVEFVVAFRKLVNQDSKNNPVPTILKEFQNNA